MDSCFCIRRKRLNEGYNLGPFLKKNLPIFWMMGPPGCGKTTLAEMLSRCSKYRLLKVSQLVKDEAGKGQWRGKLILDLVNRGRDVPDDVVLSLMKEYLILTFERSVGYIIDGFPLHIRQAKRFEQEICKVSMIIYVTLVLDALLTRTLTRLGPIDADFVRIRHIQNTKRLDTVFRKCEHKTIKLHSNYPPEDTCTRLVVTLEDFWGYKFQRLYNKN